MQDQLKKTQSDAQSQLGPRNEAQHAAPSAGMESGGHPPGLGLGAGWPTGRAEHAAYLQTSGLGGPLRATSQPGAAPARQRIGASSGGASDAASTHAPAAVADATADPEIAASANSPDTVARTAIFQASDHAKSALELVRTGKLAADAACQQLVGYVDRAFETLDTLAMDRDLGYEGDPLTWRNTQEQLDQLMVSVLDLVSMARNAATSRQGGDSAAATSLADEIQGVLVLAGSLGYRVPHTIAEANARVAVPCPPGSANAMAPGCVLTDTDRVERRGKIGLQLEIISDAFFDECRHQQHLLEAAIEKDARWAEIVIEVLAGALVGGIGGALVAGAVAAEEAKHGLELLGDTLKDAAKSVGTQLLAPGDRTAGGDRRQATVSMLDALADAEKAGVKEFVESEELNRLNDDALTALFSQLQGSTEPYRAAVRNFVAAYRQQVEPLGAPDYDDSRMAMSTASVETQAVWVTDGVDPPRLAVVKAVANASLGNEWRALKAWPQTTKLPVDEFDFVTWVDPRFAKVVADKAHDRVPIDKVKGAPRNSSQGGEPT